MAAKKSAKTKTAGAVKGGNGKYQFNMAALKKVPAGTGYSTSHGGVVEGERILAVLRETLPEFASRVVRPIP